MPAVLWRCLAVAVFLLSETARAASGSGVALVVTSPAGEPAARYFTTQVEQPIARRSSAHTGRLDILIVEARLYWPERLVVVIDLDRKTVSAARPADGTVATRLLSADAVRAPYAVALAATELLELVDNTPLARSAPVNPPVTAEPEPAKAESSASVSPTVSGGVELAQSSSGDVGLIQPILGVDLRFLSTSSPLWFSAGAHVGGLVGRTRRQPLGLPDGPDADATVDYNRNQVAVRGALAHESGEGAAVAYLDLGASSIGVTARDSGGRIVKEDARLAVFGGFGGELRRSLIQGLWLAVGAGIAFFPVTSHFLASPENSDAKIAAFEEGHLEARVHLSLIWVISR
jgi:hypothetical protein